jgi:hypothetical protein
VTSDTPDVYGMDDTTVEIKKRRFYLRRPFVFKILQLNLPEIKWIILGCVSSMIFGAITPVSPFDFVLNESF